MAHAILGLDVGTDRFRVALLEAGFRQLHLVDLIEQPIPPGPESPAERAAPRLRELIIERDLTQATLYAALPARSVSLRMLRLPFSDSRKIERVLPFELEGQLLGEASESIIDFQILDSPAPGTTRVVAAIASRQEVQGFLSALSGVGLEPRALFAAPLVYGALTSRLEIPGAGPHVLLDADRERATLVAFSGEKILMGRSLPSPQVAGGAFFGASLKQTLAWLAEEVGRPEQMFVTGGLIGGKVPGPSAIGLSAGISADALVELLSSECGVSTRSLEIPPGVLGVGGDFDAIPSIGEMALPIAIGLAGATGREEVDFRKNEFAYKANLSFLRAQTRPLVFGVGLVFLAFILSTITAYTKLSRERANLTEQLRKQTTALFGEEIDDPDLVMGKIKSGLKMDELPIPLSTAYDLLGEISTKVPPAGEVKLDFTELEIRNKKTVLRGTVDSATAVDQIKQVLSQMACFAGNDRIQKGPITNLPGQQDLKQFSLTIKSRCP